MTKAECAEFFKLTFKEFLDPLATAHFNVEGTIEFRAMLFVPGMAPFEQQVCLWTNHSNEYCSEFRVQGLGLWSAIGARSWVSDTVLTVLLVWSGICQRCPVYL